MPPSGRERSWRMQAASPSARVGDPIQSVTTLIDWPARNDVRTHVAKLSRVSSHPYMTLGRTTMCPAGAAVCSRARERSGGPGVHLPGELATFFGHVDVVESGRVDHDGGLYFPDEREAFLDPLLTQLDERDSVDFGRD